MRYGGMQLLMLPQKEGWFALDSLDLTGVRSLNLSAGWQAAPKAPVAFEVHLDFPDGQLLGKGNLSPVAPNGGNIRISISPVQDGRMHAVYFVYKPADPNATVQVGITSVELSGN